MSASLILPSSDVLLQFHLKLIGEYGGAEGVRDVEAIDSALSRAEHIISYDENPDVFKIAAAVAGGINQNHAFVDGNKRVAFAAAVVILKVNGFYFDVSEQEAFEVMMKFTTKEIDEGEFARWLCLNSTQS